MKLGEVLKKEREGRGLASSEVASRMGIPAEDYLDVEQGRSPAETWGPVLARIAIELETPTSRLLAESGRAEDTRPGQAGERIASRREEHGLSVEELAGRLEMTPEQYAAIEAGESPLETWGPRLLAFAEAVDQPIFNLFYPCGLPFQELDDYP